MSSTSTGKVRYLIRSRDDARALAEFLGKVAHDPGIDVIDLIGPRELPHTAVVEASRERARALAVCFRDTNQLIIEPDRPLSLFGDAE